MKSGRTSKTRRKAPAADLQLNEVEELRRQLEEAQDTIEAIRTGAVDAFVMNGPDGDRIFTLQSADKSYRILVECMQEGAMVLDTIGTILFANQHMAHILGRSREQLISDDLMRFAEPGQREALRALLVEGGKGVTGRLELTLASETGIIVPIHITVSPLPLEGAPVVCAIASDLTRQKAYDELQMAQQALVEVERRKDEFLATLAHELRSPLAPLRNGLQIIEMAQRDQRVLKDAQTMMKRQLQNMVRLIDDLLDISRITLGRLELRRETVALVDVIRGAIEAGRPSLVENGQTVQVSLPDDAMYVTADPVRLAQVITSLLANAGRLTGRGGRIEVTAWREGDAAVVQVGDDGAGIAATLLPYLFEMFPGPEKTAERMNAGFGVALSIAARMVELHGGTITAKSDGKNQGSEYTFRLPLVAHSTRGVPAPQVPERRSPRERPTPHEQRRRRILVADDNIDSASSLAQLLTLSGHDVRTAYRGTEAYDLAEWFRPHIALLDLAIPDQDGFEICRRIKGQPWGRTVTLIAVTGWDQPSHEDASREAGFDHHLVKPIEPSQLMALLDRLPVPVTEELLG